MSTTLQIIFIVIVVIAVIAWETESKKNKNKIQQLKNDIRELEKENAVLRTKLEIKQ